MALRIPRLRINRLWLVLGGAIVMGLLAAWLSVGYLKNRETVIKNELAEKAKGGPSASVVVANNDLPKGTLIEGGMMAGRDVPNDLLYDDVVLADNFGEIEGKRLLRPVLKGRPLRKSDVFDDRPRDLSTDVTPGNRALTFDIDEINSFAQMLRAGSYVDLYLIAQNPSAPSTAGAEIRPLLPKVRVIATGPALQVPPEVEQMRRQAAGSAAAAAASYSNITVDVTPEQAVRIALATQAGKIRAVLRKPEAENDMQMAQMSTNELFQGGKKGRNVSYIVGGAGGTGGSTAPTSITIPNIPGMPNIPGVTSAAPGATGAPPATSLGVQASVPGMPSSVNSSIPVAPTGMAR